jgi:hypothetical protein
MSYTGPAIHDGSPIEHVSAALVEARQHSVPAVRDYLVRHLTAHMEDFQTELVRASELQTGDVVRTDVGPVRLGTRTVTQRADDTVISFDGRMLDVSAVPADCQWIVRMNRADGLPAGQWTVQRADWVRMERYVTAAAR